MRQAAPKFTPAQPVTLTFSDGNTYDAVIIENIDHVCRPLTDMWQVQILIDGKPCRKFGFTGKAITARAA
jgi:hypothetical protein